jgi:hypothetical protein
MSPSRVTLFNTFTDNIFFGLYLYFNDFNGTICTFYWSFIELGIFLTNY